MIVTILSGETGTAGSAQRARLRPGHGAWAAADQGVTATLMTPSSWLENSG